MSWFFGEYLQRLLDERDWTASKLAKKANLSHVYMGTLLRGDKTEGNKQSRISVETVTSIAKAFEVPEYKLLLAYKGIDPDKANPFPQEGFNLYGEIYAAASRKGIDLNELDPQTKDMIETNILRMSRRYIELLVEDELGKLKKEP